MGIVVLGGYLILSHPSRIDRAPNQIVPVNAPVPLSQNLFLSAVGTLQEAGSEVSSANPDWWLSSGGYFYVASSGAASTVIGSLPVEDRWRLIYNKNNPIDTDGGYHPQNIFRLTTRSQWQNFTEQAYFLIKANNLSTSTNRNESNGLFLFNRYESAQTLYYTGVRVDGAAVIKKKIDGTYYTMATQQIFPGIYSQTSTPNLLPMNEWIGLRSIVQTNPDRSVAVSLYTDIGKTGNWQEVLSAIDDGMKYGGAPILSPGYVGIRTDFMDVEFDDFQVRTN